MLEFMSRNHCEYLSANSRSSGTKVKEEGFLSILYLSNVFYKVTCTCLSHIFVTAKSQQLSRFELFSICPNNLSLWCINNTLDLFWWTFSTHLFLEFYLQLCLKLSQVSKTWRIIPSPMLCPYFPCTLKKTQEGKWSCFPEGFQMKGKNGYISPQLDRLRGTMKANPNSRPTTLSIILKYVWKLCRK